MSASRLLWTGALALIVGVLAGCGDQGSTGSGAPPGSPGNPLVGEIIPEDEPETGPREILRPCDLVSRSAPGAKEGVPFSFQEAPQGPTCLIRTKVDGRDQLITLSVQSVDFANLRSHLQQPRTVAISGRTAYCGQYGQAMLYLPLGTHRVLSIGAPCPLASKFAVGAMERLDR